MRRSAFDPLRTLANGAPRAAGIGSVAGWAGRTRMHLRPPGWRSAGRESRSHSLDLRNAAATLAFRVRWGKLMRAAFAISVGLTLTAHSASAEIPTPVSYGDWEVRCMSGMNSG